MNRGSRNEGVADSEDIRTPSSQRGPGNDDMDKETAALLRIAALAEEFNHPTISDQARSAAERIAEGRFYVACLGQFKRGKSTLLNALVGEAILPAGVTPVTAVPTILRFGSDRRARVRQTNGDWREIAISEIEVYVSEAKNPENIREVAALEVFVPSALLRSGMCLVDTPGLGSVFAGNTAATHAFLPHIDAAIVVIGADPPIAGDELALVESLTKQIPDILFVLNKADRVSDGERSAAAAFCKSVLQEKLHHQVQTIYEVSALEQLNRQRPQRDWEQLLMRMENLAENSQRGLVHDASRRSLRRLSRQFTDVLNEERSALTRPIEESEKRLQQLREIVAQSEQSLSDLGFLLGGEQQRLSRTFGDRRNTFLESAEQTAHQQLALVIATLPRTLGPRYRRAVMDAAQNVARRQVLPWLESEAENAEDAYRQITKRFVH
ncbi:MAG TPA: dynamin family protein, partial [Terriglobales bacterium]